MRPILIDVDTQHDFCDPNGALFVRGADALAPRFQALVARAVDTGTPIVGSVDSHAFDAWEFAGAHDAGPNGERPGFPPHCVKGTRGWLKVAGTLPPRTRFVPNVRLPDDELAALVERRSPHALMLEKEVYSFFANPNAEAALARVARGAARFLVFGVATDYCVRAAALGLCDWLAKDRREGDVWLVGDAIAAVDPAGGEAALAECLARGARTVTTREALAAMAGPA
ncbi:MAG: cysteine hydrolase [Deltaproteobacteria bacterium]|nr:cysteine hydrolase [Deltaproteobacteria bacterium]